MKILASVPGKYWAAIDDAGVLTVARSVGAGFIPYPHPQSVQEVFDSEDWRAVTLESFEGGFNLERYEA